MDMLFLANQLLALLCLKLFCDGSQGVFGALSSLILLQTLPIEFQHSNDNQLFSNDLSALCNLRCLTVLYIYYGYAAKPLDCA